MVCGTEGAKHPTAELAIGLMIDLARNISVENARMKAGEPWQATVGADLFQHTLGIIGLGNLGAARRQGGAGLRHEGHCVEPESDAGEMHASSASNTPPRPTCSRNPTSSPSIWCCPTARRGLVGATDLAMMKPTAYLINTSRGPIIDEAALIAALQKSAIAGAGLDVFDVEPLPVDHPYRKLPNVILTPHLGYVTQDGYRLFYGGMVEAIRAWLDGKPIRVIP